jgi:hypothetical protein
LSAAAAEEDLDGEGGETLAKSQSMARAMRGLARRVSATRSAARIIGTVMKSEMTMKRRPSVTRFAAASRSSARTG